MAAPLVGAAMDASGWRSGHLLSGLLGLAVALVVIGAVRAHRACRVRPV